MAERKTTEDRTLIVKIDEKGIIKSVTDPTLTPELSVTGIKFGAGKTDEELPLEGEQYEWDLSKYKETGVDVLHMYTGRSQFATNVRSNGKHRNSVGLTMPKLIKLDCGHWGAYKRHREFDGQGGGPQREFGIIENGHVWLCQYYTGPHAQNYNSTTKIELGNRAPVAYQLAKRVGETGAAIRLIHYAQATPSLMPDPAVNAKMYVCFPDLHLPEAWPEIPPMAERNPNRASRMALQERLRDCQREPHLAVGSTLSQENLDEMQAFLEAIEPWNRNGRPGAGPNVTYSFTTGVIGFRKTHVFTPVQFMAEKAIVDREFRLRSTWFYGRGPNYAVEADAGDSDWKDAIDANGNGDATPGMALLDLLLAIREVKLVDFAGAPRVEVVQLGDIYEAWLGREFLYHGFWVRDSEAGALPAYVAIRKQASGMAFALDSYQYRMDEDWYDAAANPAQRRQAKRYVYHPVPKDVMYRRHVVGDMVEPASLNNEGFIEHVWGLPHGELARRQRLLRARINNVKNHSLPVPANEVPKIASRVNGCAWLAAQYTQRLGALAAHAYNDYDGQHAPRVVNYHRFAGAQGAVAYTRDNRLGQGEVLWNKLILDLFTELQFIGVYGNHDGYRGDPLLNKKLGAGDRCPGWVSHPGIWFEHSHRWDAYNRDGCAFGAGAANLVYYYFNNLCNADSGRKESYFAKQEQACFQPGAALWFLLANYGRELPWLKCQKGFAGGGPPVHKFGVYVSGHTHSGDLCIMRFRFNQETRLKLSGDDVAVTTKTPEEIVAERDIATQVSTFNARQGGDLNVATNRLSWLKPRPTT